MSGADVLLYASRTPELQPLLTGSKKTSWDGTRPEKTGADWSRLEQS